MYDTAPYRPLDDRPLVQKHAAHDLPGISADATDRYDLTRAIRECDRAIEALSQIRAIHTSNLCRVANRLAFGAVDA